MIILRLYDWVFSPDAGRSGRMSRLCSGVMPMIRYVVSVAIVAGAVFVSAFWSDPALADKRVALVIGNSNYRNVPKLPNPSADASAIAEQLKNAGFDSVDLEIDVENLDFKRAIRKFEHIASDVDIAVIFFAGHGIELRGIDATSHCGSLCVSAPKEPAQPSPHDDKKRPLADRQLPERAFAKHWFTC